MERFLKKYHYIHLAEVTSTNLHASALLSAQRINAPSLVLADFQTKGKGQGANSWSSEAGKNLLLSLIVFPKNIEAFEQFYLSKITALAILELISDKTGSAEVKIKWPNDILCENNKMAGILIENTIEGNKIKNSVIGTGINVNQTEFEHFPLRASSIKSYTKYEISISHLLNAFIEIFDYWFNLLENREFNQIDLEYLKHLYGFQKNLTFSRQGVVFEARIMDVKKNGELVLLMDNNKRQKFGYKEIEFVIT